MNIAILLYDRFTALDAIGPYEVLSRLPGASVTFVAAERGPGAHRQRHADAARRALAAGDAGRPTSCSSRAGRARSRRARAGRLEWLRAAHETSTWTTSVCTGSLMLAAAGPARRAACDEPLAGARAARARSAPSPSQSASCSTASSSPRRACRPASTWRSRSPRGSAARQSRRRSSSESSTTRSRRFDAGSPQKAPPEIVRGAALAAPASR